MSIPIASGPSPAPALVYDIVVRVMDLCSAQDDYALLASAARVNWEWNRAATRVLYAHVVVAPPFKSGLDLRDRGALPESSNFTSACLPRNAPYVLTLEISGYTPTRPPPRNALSEALPGALRAFGNLRTVVFTPVTYYAELFTAPLGVLLNSRALTELTVNSACAGDVHAPQLVQLGGLRALTLVSPGRAVLELLPDWLARLVSTLEELHLKDNCGSVTPGVLRALVPHIRTNVVALTLGLSYSLADADVCVFLGALTALRSVDLRYYWQMRRAPRPPALRALRTFSAACPPLGSARELADLGVWVRRAIGGAEVLCVLRLSSADDVPPPRAPDGLLDHVARRHAALSVLDLGTAGVRLRRFKNVLKCCPVLEEVCVGVDRRMLDAFAEASAHLMHLHTVVLWVLNTPRAWGAMQLETKARTLLATSPPALRRVTINSQRWEAHWRVAPTGDTELVVHAAAVLLPPWRRAVDG